MAIALRAKRADPETESEELVPTLESFTLSGVNLLRWLYIGRVAVLVGILGGVLYVWREADADLTLAATVMFLVAMGVTLASAWHTHLRRQEPSENFLYAHVVLDVLLVTGIIHITGGQQSSFSPLYVLVIAEGALLLPLPGGVLIGGFASILYFADLFWFHQGTFGGTVLYQIVLFAAVALATGLLGDRLRRAGIALGAVESELRQLRLDTGEILGSMSTGVLTVDEEGRLMYVNPAGEALLGMDARQWLGAPVISAVERIAPGMGMVLKRSIEDGLPITRFRTIMHRGEKEIVLGVSTTVTGREDGSSTSATAIFQDISDLERVDALNRRAERLEAVAELSASLAHEIKNPLASIRSAVEQISKPALTNDDRSLLQRLVVSESDRLSRLLTEFLEFSGLRMSKREIVDVRAVARDCVTMLKHHPDRPEGVEIELTLPDDAQRVRGDRDLLHRALFNLVLNALQFAGRGGKVAVHVRRHTRVGGVLLRDMVRLVVSDTGPGVNAEDLPKIFDPFYTRRKGGTGLGLAVVHRAVAAHEGTVLVERSRLGGADFVVDLPRYASTLAEETAAS
jgi:two-component system sensor histidine kinase PilS (NtrC family)